MIPEGGAGVQFEDVARALKAADATAADLAAEAFGSIMRGETGAWWTEWTAD